MSEELQAPEELTADLLARLADRREDVREAASEALAVATEDEDWRPDDLILSDGIDILLGLLGERSLHIVRSALTILLAIAAAGHKEALLSQGAIDRLEPMQGHRDRAIREKVREALWLLTPDVEDVVAQPALDED